MRAALALPALALALPLVTAAYLPSSPSLGREAGRCRVREAGPAFIVTPVGLKDREGTLKLELYPANDKDFLQDDNVLVMEGKTFARVEMPVPRSGPVSMCIRTPGPGTYALSLLHDRDGNRKFGWTVDGIGFSSNPKLGWSKPKASHVDVVAGTGLTTLRIVLNYRSGLGMAPLPRGGTT
jgi:uncharacterized protein (DUF2141 family)